MWDHYKKTFGKMQATIGLVSVAVFFGLHRNWLGTLIFFGMMQLGGLAGAVWAAHLKRKFGPQAS